MPLTTEDRKFAEIALEMARQSKAEDDRPHPSVGALVVKDGKELARSFRGEFPKNHAEMIALERKLAESEVSGSTVFATLEPCTTRNHPKVPCAERLAERKVKRVVIGMLDPNPKICGRGVLILRRHGVEIELFDPDLMTRLEELNRDFSRQFKALDNSRAVIAELRDHLLAGTRTLSDVLTELEARFSDKLSEDFRKWSQDERNGYRVNQSGGLVIMQGVGIFLDGVPTYRQPAQGIVDASLATIEDCLTNKLPLTAPTMGGRQTKPVERGALIQIVQNVKDEALKQIALVEEKLD
jgi:pyrimidine deaminase RibD-like protein